jgi:FkbM family methyltransferase
MNRAQVFAAEGPEGELYCPDDMYEHSLKVLCGEYDIPGLELHEPRVLDIGANVGAFALWASERWPGARVQCYEPHPVAFAYLERNVKTDVPSLHMLAVGSDTGPGRMWRGKNNLGEASFFRGVEQTEDFIEVECMNARDLPGCDVLKIDTEGSELRILNGYLPVFRPLAIVLEFHSEADRISIDHLLVGRQGYTLLRARIDRPDRGILCYLRADRLRMTEAM